MAFTDTEQIRARINALRAPRGNTSYASGLASGLRDIKANSLSRELEASEEQNATLKQQEMQQLINAMTGAQAPMKPGMSPNFQHPDVQQLALAQQLSNAAPKDPYTLSAGARRFGGDNQLLAENPRSNATNVNVNTQGNQFLKDFGGMNAAYLDESRKAADIGFQRIDDLERFKTQSPSAAQGSLQPLVTAFKNLGASFDVNMEGLTEETLMQQSLSDIMVGYLQQMGARGLTDGENRKIAESLPMLTSSREARESVADILIARENNIISEYANLRGQVSEAYPESFQPSSQRFGQWQEREDVIKTYMEDGLSRSDAEELYRYENK